MIQAPPLDVTATRDGLAISGTGDIQFLIHASESTEAGVQETEWQLPGLTIRLTTDARRFTEHREGQDIQADYSATTTVNFTIELPGKGDSPALHSN